MRALLHVLWWILPLLPAGSIFGDIAGFFEGVGNSIAGVAEKVWHAISTVWAFLVKAAELVFSAWDWMVNGAIWLGTNIEGWAAFVYHGLEHIIFHVIPEAARWAYEHALKWAAAAIHDVKVGAEFLYHTLRHWAEVAIHTVENIARDLFHKVTRWASEAVGWVLHFGRRVWALISHPEAMAEWLLSHIALPVIKFLIKASGLILYIFLAAFRDLIPEIVDAAEYVVEKLI